MGSLHGGQASFGVIQAITYGYLARSPVLANTVEIDDGVVVIQFLRGTSWKLPAQL